MLLGIQLLDALDLAPSSSKLIGGPLRLSVLTFALNSVQGFRVQSLAATYDCDLQISACYVQSYQSTATLLHSRMQRTLLSRGRWPLTSLQSSCKSSRSPAVKTSSLIARHIDPSSTYGPDSCNAMHHQQHLQALSEKGTREAPEIKVPVTLL